MTFWRKLLALPEKEDTLHREKKRNYPTGSHKNTLKCPDCGAHDGNYTVSRNDDGCIIFQCNSCNPEIINSLCAIASCTVGEMLDMFVEK